MGGAVELRIGRCPADDYERELVIDTIENN